MLPRPPPSRWAGTAAPPSAYRIPLFQVCRLAGFTTRSASEHWRRSDLVPLPTILPLLGERARGEGGRISPGGAALPRRPLLVFAPCTPEPPSRPAFARLRQPIHFCFPAFPLFRFSLLRPSAVKPGFPVTAAHRVNKSSGKNKKPGNFRYSVTKISKNGCSPPFFAFFQFVASPSPAVRCDANGGQKPDPKNFFPKNAIFRY